MFSSAAVEAAQPAFAPANGREEMGCASCLDHTVDEIAVKVLDIVRRAFHISPLTNLTDAESMHACVVQIEA
jgi:hypothetical protein